MTESLDISYGIITGALIGFTYIWWSLRKAVGVDLLRNPKLANGVIMMTLIWAIVAVLLFKILPSITESWQVSR